MLLFPKATFISHAGVWKNSITRSKQGTASPWHLLLCTESHLKKIKNKKKMHRLIIAKKSFSEPSMHEHERYYVQTQLGWCSLYWEGP